MVSEMKKTIQSQNPKVIQALKKLFLKGYSSLISIILFFSIFLTGWGNNAVALSPESNGDNPLQIIIEPSDTNEEIVDQEIKTPINEIVENNYPDLGDDQVFPFAAGLDSY